MHIRSTSTSLLLLLSLFSITTSALPAAGKARDSPKPRKSNKEDSSDCHANTFPALPPSTLPSFTPGLVLKHILLGHGTQNYTCSTPSTPPSAAGALASLYDVSCLADTPQARSQLDNILIPSLLAVPATQMTSFLASSVSSFPKGEDAINPTPMGVHFFRDGTTPFFQLNDGGFIAAGKVAGCVAPSGATGNENGAAVDWLKLVRKQGEVTGGIEEVYRVITAGGRAPAGCASAGQLTVDYVAQYWMYG